MKVPWTWLNEYVKLPWSPQEAAERLTMAGINVEQLTYEELGIASVVSGKILDVKPHPQKRDQMIGTVDTGTQVLRIVSGAPGFKKGNATLIALPGAVLAGGLRIGEKTIGGEPSQGMALCTNELLTGQPPRPWEDIILLPKDITLGVSAQELFELDDWVMELELTVNYSHCLGILGVALEASALSGIPLILPDVLDEWDWAGARGSRDPNPHKSPQSRIQIDLPEPNLCPRYLGKLLENTQFGYSPVNIERRLYLAGQRPLGLIVDVTNFVMLETGQPLHAFDADLISQKKITVRSSSVGESLVTLDGEKRVLPKGTVVIADAQRPIAIAGIMGGMATEITPDTRKVFIESAYFDPLSVRIASQNLKLRTEAALRFEKGVDPTAQAAAAERAAGLIFQLSGGRPIEGFAETDYFRPESKRISLRMKNVERVLGCRLSSETCGKILESIRFKIDEKPLDKTDEESLWVLVPPRRVDIQEEVDLIEEIARHYGYEKLGSGELSRVVLGGLKDPAQKTVETIREILKSSGGMECVTNSLLDPEILAALGWDSHDPRGNPVRLLNPLSSQESVLRTSLLPGLVNAAAANLRSGIQGAFIWEIGRVFLNSPELPLETIQIGLASYGVLKPQTWLLGQRESGFYQMKGVLSALTDHLGVSEIKYLPGASMPFHPGRSAKILADMSTVGEIGELHPICLKELDIPAPVTAAWLYFDGLTAAAKPRRFHGVPRFMPVERDLAVVVPEEVPAGDVLNSVKNSGTNLVSVILFDVWRKPPVPSNHKSLALRLKYQPLDKTFAEEDLLEDRERIMKRLKQDYGAWLRV